MDTEESTTEYDYFAVFSKRLNSTISGCRVKAKLATEKLVFVIEGNYYPRFELDSATRKLKTEGEDLEIYALFSETNKQSLGTIPLRSATHDDFEQVSESVQEHSSAHEVEEVEDEDEAEVLADEPVASTKEVEEEDSDLEIYLEPNMSAKTLEALKEGKDDVYIEPKMSEERRQALLRENLDAQNDSQIESDEDDEDSKDQELAKYDGSYDGDDPADEDVADQFANIEQKIFKVAPRKFTIEVKSKLAYVLTLSKDLEKNCFKLDKVEIDMDADLRKGLNRRKARGVKD